MRINLHLQTVIFLSMLWTSVWMKHISGTISEDITFFHMGLSDFPSKQATVEYFIQLNLTNLFANCSQYDCAPIFGLHTTNDDKHVIDRCFSRPFGQVRNTKLRTPLRTREPVFIHSSQVNESFDPYDGVLVAEDNIKIYDFLERNFSFSLGFKCSTLLVKQNLSLKGISYDINFHQQKHNVSCNHKEFSAFTGILHDCPQFYSHMSEENLVGVTELHLSDEDDDKKIMYLETFKKAFLYDNDDVIFYKYFDEILCHFFVPECSVKEDIVIHPCQEMCYDFVVAFWKILKQSIPKLVKLFPSVVKKLQQIYEYDDALDCSYLPSQNDSVPCYYQPVICGPPPNVANAKVKYGEKLVVNSTAEYSCVDDHAMVGNSTVTCLYSGHWSEPPICRDVSVSNSPVAVVIIILLLPLSLFVAVVFWYSCKKQKLLKKEASRTFYPRETEFDAFLCYNFDRDNNFVVNELLPEIDETIKTQEIEIEEQQLLIPKPAHGTEERIRKQKTHEKQKWCRNNDPVHKKNSNPDNKHQDCPRMKGFKILIESRDFVPALLVDVNIENAIKTSNCTILLISQGFVNSPWCRKEFELCKLENENDRSFKIFVIMMQPENELENVNSSMRRFLETTTFLKKDDPDLFKKLSHNLNELRKIHGCPA